MKRKYLIKTNYPILNIIFCLLVVSICASCSPIFIEGTFCGKVIDDDTHEPIAGAVALARWSKTHPSPAGEVGYISDARDVVTDENGEFCIPGKGIRLFTFLNHMSVVVFKAGYRANAGWSDEPDDKGNYTISLKKMTYEGWRKWGNNAPDPPTEMPYEKVKNYLKELDRDAVVHGLKPRGIWGGVKYDYKE